MYTNRSLAEEVISMHYQPTSPVQQEETAYTLKMSINRCEEVEHTGDFDSYQNHQNDDNAELLGLAFKIVLVILIAIVASVIAIPVCIVWIVGLLLQFALTMAKCMTVLPMPPDFTMCFPRTFAKS